jgi:uncharacterized phage protein gp47/JayE
VTSPTPVDYSARDYDTIKQSLIARIPVHLPEWTNRSENDFGIVLIELFAYQADMLAFYIDRAANESSLQNAIRRETVLSFAGLVGYVPDDMVPSSGSVTFTAAPGRTADAVIPAGTLLYTYSPSSDTSPVPFTTDEDLVIDTASSSGSVSVTQGEMRVNELVGTSSGAASITASLFEVGVVVESVVVDVLMGDDSLLEAGATDQVFIVTVDVNGVAFVMFGDGANGLIPPSNALIHATYRTAIGARGNISAANTITVVAESIDGVASVTNPAPVTGGTDRESIDEIRRNLPGSIKALNRATTLEDFEPLAEQVAGVLHAKATAEVYTSVIVYVVPVGGGTPSADLKADVETYLEERALIGTDVTVLNPAYEEVNVTLDLFVLPTFFAQETEDRVDDALTSFFLLQNMDLGKTVTVSDIYRVIHEVAGVDYVEVTMLARADAPQTGTAPQLFLVNEVPIRGTVGITTTGGV